MTPSLTLMAKPTNLRILMKLLASCENKKKKRYPAPCLAQHHHFTPSIVSADGLLSHEADVMVCHLAGKN